VARGSGRALAATLLARAREDMQTLEALVGADVPDRAVGFHAEQVVEKSLKAVLADREVDYRQSHDIGYLLELAVANGIEPPADLGEARRLRPFATELRYEHPVDATPDLDRGEALRLSRLALRWARDRAGGN
jgi:HEPN domain-containing protein